MGECVADTGDLCEEADYVPCAGKSCGETCTVCGLGDEDCVESTELKACDPQGECVSYQPDLCDDVPYEPCANKSCGDICTICAPGDDDCVETTEIKACDPEGVCVSIRVTSAMVPMNRVLVNYAVSAALSAHQMISIVLRQTKSKPATLRVSAFRIPATSVPMRILYAGVSMMARFGECS